MSFSITNTDGSRFQLGLTFSFPDATRYYPFTHMTRSLRPPILDLEGHMQPRAVVSCRWEILGEAKAIELGVLRLKEVFERWFPEVFSGFHVEGNQLKLVLTQNLEIEYRQEGWQKGVHEPFVEMLERLGVPIPGAHIKNVYAEVSDDEPKKLWILSRMMSTVNSVGLFREAIRQGARLDLRDFEGNTLLHILAAPQRFSSSLQRSRRVFSHLDSIIYPEYSVLKILLAAHQRPRPQP